MDHSSVLELMQQAIVALNKQVTKLEKRLDELEKSPMLNLPKQELPINNSGVIPPFWVTQPSTSYRLDCKDELNV